MRRRALIWGSVSAVLVGTTKMHLRADAGPRRALVLAPAGVHAYQEAAEALTEELRASEFEIVRTDPEDAVRVAEASSSSNVVVAIGVGSLRQAIRVADGPIVSAMCLRSQVESAAAESGRERNVVAVALDLRIADVAREARRLFPEARRLGILRRRGQGDDPKTLAAAAAGAGLVLHLAECDGPADLVETFVAMRTAADVVWCPADETLYSATTVKPLILASLKIRLGVIGFSSGIVHAGAAAGVLPDFRAIGRRAGELAVTAQEAGRSRIEDCPAYRVALNRRVLRILGLKPRIPQQGDGIEVLG